MTEQQFLKKINIGNDYLFDSYEEFLNEFPYDDIPFSYVLGDEFISDAIYHIGNIEFLDSIEIHAFYFDNEDYYVVVFHSGGNDTFDFISAYTDKHNAEKDLDNLYNELKNKYYYFEDITEVPIEYCEWRWSDNAQKSIEVGICPIEYFNSYDNARTQL